MHSALIITIRVIMYVVLAAKIGNEKRKIRFYFWW